MSVHSMQRKRRRDPAKLRYKSMGSHEEFLSRISKSLYYGHLPKTERFSLPVTELAAELFSEVKSGRSLDRLHLEEAADMSRNACVSPASLVLAMLYLERLKISAPEFVHRVSSSQLFLVSSLIANKFLQDDGEEDEVFNSEWAASADIPLAQLNRLEKDFLAAIKWDVYVEVGEFWKRLEWLEEEVAMRQGSKRGWFSYADLTSLLHSIDSVALANALLSVGAVCLTAYAAGVVSMVGSTALVSTLYRPGLYTTSTSLPTDRSSNDSDHSMLGSQDKLGQNFPSLCHILRLYLEKLYVPFKSDWNCTEDSVKDPEKDSLDGCEDCGSVGCDTMLMDCDLSNDPPCVFEAPGCCSNSSGPPLLDSRVGCEPNGTRWFTGDLLESYSLSNYLLGSVAQPFYSYVRFVASQ